MYPHIKSISVEKFHSKYCVLEKWSQYTFLSKDHIQRCRESSFAVWDINTGSCVFAEKRSSYGLIQIIKDRVIYNNLNKGMICCDMKTKKVMFTLSGLSSFAHDQISYDNFVAAACVDRTIHVYDLKKKKKILILETVQVVYGLSLTESKLIYQTQSEIYIYDLKTLTPIRQIQIPPSKSRSFCHNQKNIIHVSENYPNRLLIRDLREGRIIQKLRGPVDSITNFKMTDNRVVAISSKNKSIWIWDRKSGQLKKTFNVSHGGGVRNFQIENNILHLSISHNPSCKKLGGDSQFWDLTNCRLVSEVQFEENEDFRIVRSHYEDRKLTYLYISSEYLKGRKYNRYVVRIFKYE